MKNCLGIEIGHYRVKIAYMEHGELQTYVSERLETENQTESIRGAYKGRFKRK